MTEKVSTNGKWRRNGGDHSRDCWQEHPLCALRAARDLEQIRAAHAAGQAHRFDEAASRAVRPDRLSAEEALAIQGAVARARSVMAEEIERQAVQSRRPRARRTRRSVQHPEAS